MIRQNFYDNKKWIKFKKACRENIKNSKLIQNEFNNPFKTSRGSISKFVNAFDILFEPAHK